MLRVTPTSHGHRPPLCTMVHNTGWWCTMYSCTVEVVHNIGLTLREETSVLEYLSMLISSSGCNDLIRYLEMFNISTNMQYIILKCIKNIKYIMQIHVEPLERFYIFQVRFFFSEKPVQLDRQTNGCYHTYYLSAMWSIMNPFGTYYAPHSVSFLTWGWAVSSCKVSVTVLSLLLKSFA